ncbi:MAG: insulinase family protein [Planctomycetota bacterium]|nr:insulinase family protein [Planctomycetota bacterium]
MSDGIVEFVLDNGLKVLLKEMRSSPVVSVFVWYRVGSKNERPGITGVSHWVEHMMFQGTRRFGKGQHFKKISAAGGVLNGFTNNDCTVYFETVPAAHAGMVLDMEADRMRNALFDEAEVERERTVIISEREGAENDPIYMLYEEVEATMYRNHPYRWPVIGWKRDLQAMTRKDLYDYYLAYYSPANAVLVVTGDFDAKAMEGEVRKYFGPVEGPKPPAFSCAPELPQAAERRVNARGPKGSPHLVAAYHGPTIADAEAPAAIVLDAILSGAKPLGPSAGGYMGRSARLYDALVRRRKVAASAGSHYFPNDGPSAFAFSLSVQPGVRTEKAEKALFDEIERVRENPVPASELRKALRQTMAQLEYSRDGITANAFMIGRFEMLGSHRILDDLIARIEKVTPEDVRNVARKYLNPENRTVGIYEPAGSGATGPVAKGGAKDDAKDRAGAGTAGGAAGGSAGGGPGGWSGRGCAWRPTEAAASGGSAYGGGYARPAPGCYLQDSGVRATTPPSSGGRPIQRRQMPNGVIALVLENPESHSVVIQGGLKAGLAFEAPAKHGIASLVSRMLLRGTAKRNARRIAEFLESKGASLDFWCGDEAIGFGGKCLPGDEDCLITTLAECLSVPAFPEGEVESARGQMLAELKRIEDSPERVSRRALEKMLYPEGHPYNRHAVENAGDIASLTRADCEEYHRRLFGPASLVVAIVGRIEASGAFELVEKSLGDWNGAPAQQPPPASIPPSASERRQVITMEKKSQNELVAGLRAVPRSHPDYYALAVANHIFGRLGLMGRLGDRIRDRMGLAYHAYSSLSARLWDGEWIAAAGINPKNVRKAEDALLAEIRLLLKDGVTAEELSAAQENLVGSMPIRLETNNGLAGLVCDIEHYGLGLDFREKFPRIIRGLTREALIEAVRKHLDPEKLLIVVAGPTPAE